MDIDTLFNTFWLSNLSVNIEDYCLCCAGHMVHCPNTGGKPKCALNCPCPARARPCRRILLLGYC